MFTWKILEDKLDRLTKDIKEHIDLKLTPVCQRLNEVETDSKTAHDFITSIKAVKYTIFVIAGLISFIVGIATKYLPFGNHK